VKRSKPDPESYLVAVERLKRTLGLNGLIPSRCVAIEDTPAGIQSAKGAGLTVVAVTNSFPREHLSGANLVLENLSRLDFSELAKIVAAADAISR
jgi:beta-phosphoglucomutase